MKLLRQSIRLGEITTKWTNFLQFERLGSQDKKSQILSSWWGPALYLANGLLLAQVPFYGGQAGLSLDFLLYRHESHSTGLHPSTFLHPKTITHVDWLNFNFRFPFVRTSVRDRAQHLRHARLVLWPWMISQAKNVNMETGTGLWCWEQCKVMGLRKGEQGAGSKTGEEAAWRWGGRKNQHLLKALPTLELHVHGISQTTHLDRWRNLPEPLAKAMEL